jgi:hypothetical protein
VTSILPPATDSLEHGLSLFDITIPGDIKIIARPDIKPLKEKENSIYNGS